MTRARWQRPARSRLRIPLRGALLACALFGALSDSASAVIVQTPSGPASYAPRLNAARNAAGALSANGNLDYHSGPVMPSSVSHVIYWAPTGYSYATGYKTLINQFLGDVAADSGQSTNVHSVLTQYTDTTGPARANYSATFAGGLDDTTAYPTSGCAVPADFTSCLTKAQISSEVDSFLTAHSLPRGLTNIYFVVFPDNVDSCLNGPDDCFSSTFCAYHTFNNTGDTTIFADIPYVDHYGAGGCGPAEHPNSDISAHGDEVLDLISHEYREAINDPRLDAWFNGDLGHEGSDQCAGSYGTELGGSPGSLYNQSINGHDYYLQREWSNSSNDLGYGGCEQQNLLPIGAFTPPDAISNSPTAFDGSNSYDPDGLLAGYSWHFGDGSPAASGATPNHTFPHPGTFSVQVAVTDANDFAGTETQDVTAVAPLDLGRVTLNKHRGTATLPTSTGTGGALKLSGSDVKPQSASPAAAADIPLTVKATGKSANTLKTKGSVKVTAKLRFTPHGGTKYATSKTITLKKS